MAEKASDWQGKKADLIDRLLDIYSDEKYLIDQVQQDLKDDGEFVNDDEDDEYQPPPPPEDDDDEEWAAWVAVSVVMETTTWMVITICSLAVIVIFPIMHVTSDIIYITIFHHVCASVWSVYWRVSV